MKEGAKTVSREQFNHEYYSHVEFSFKLTRRPTYYTTTLLLPCLILLSIILSTYFLPVYSGERMTVTVMTLLGMAVLFEFVSERLPHSSNSMSLLLVYMLVSMSHCCLSFLTTCLVVALSRKNEATHRLKPPPKLLSRLLHPNSNDLKNRENSKVEKWENFEEMSTIIRHLNPSVDAIEEMRCLKSISGCLVKMRCSLKSQVNGHLIHLEWIKLSHFVDRLSFWVFLSFSIFYVMLLFFAFYFSKR